MSAAQAPTHHQTRLHAAVPELSLPVRRRATREEH
jgi:hypothetical protein